MTSSPTRQAVPRSSPDSMDFSWSTSADRLASGHLAIRFSTSLTNAFASSSDPKRPTVSATPNACGRSLASGMTKMRDWVARTDFARKFAESHWVAAGLTFGRNGLTPAHTLSMSAIGGRSTMPRNAGASDVRGGSVRDDLDVVGAPAAALRADLRDGVVEREGEVVDVGSGGAVDLVHERARDGAGVAEADGERALGGAVRAQPQDAEVAERPLHDVRADQLDPRMLAVGVPADEALVGLLGLLGVARDLDGLGHALVGLAAAPRRCGRTRGADRCWRSAWWGRWRTGSWTGCRRRCRRPSRCPRGRAA